MKTRWVAVVGLWLVPLTGCLSPPCVLDRTTEGRRPVTFENTEAANTFSRGRRADRTPVDGCTSYWLAAWRHRTYVVPSDAGRYNDAVQRCDTNQDGVITFAEASYYAYLNSGK